MFKPSLEQSQKAHQKIKESFESMVKQSGKYTIVYAFYNKKGIFSEEVFIYIVGFNNENIEMVIMPINEKAVAMQQPTYLTREDIQSLKIGIQKDYKLKSTKLEKELRFFVFSYVPTTYNKMYLLPIEQKQEEEQFKTFVKENF